MIDYTRTSTASIRKGFDEGLRNYMLKIYNLMAIALVVTAISGFATLYFEPLTRLVFNVTPAGQILGYSGIGSLLMFAPLGIALYFFIGINRITTQTANVLFWVYSIVTGISLSSLGLVYTGESITLTFLICASMFGAMSIYGYSTKRDLSAMGSFLMMGLIGIIIASLFNLFFQSAAINFATSILGVVIFTGLIAWDTQKLKAIYYSAGNSEVGQKMAILGAFTLYLDFINLFLYLLRFFGQRKD